MANISGRASSEIDAPVEAVWAVVQDVSRWAEWQAALGRVDVIETDSQERATECKVDIDAKITKISMTLVCDYIAPTELTFTRTSGSLSSLEGTWRLEDLGDGRTRATYELEVDPGSVIGFLLNAERKEKLRALLVDARPGELKERVEGG